MLSLLLFAAADPTTTYLSCSFPSNGTVLELTADEPNQAVSVVLASSGYAEKMPAAFTPTEVRFENRVMGYVLSRTDLSVRRTTKMISDTDVGSCKIQQPPKRAF